MSCGQLQRGRFPYFWTSCAHWRGGIEHGVRAIDVPALVAELAERGIALDVAPGSNPALGVYPSIDAHPIERLRCAGVRVSVNTDDPALFGTSSEQEYERCMQAFGWDADTLRAVAQTSIDASFAPCIGKSNGMFSCPSARAHPHWVVHRGDLWRVLAWQVAH